MRLPARLGLYALAAVFVGAGTLHFVRPGPYVRIMPPYLPAHEALVFWSGVAEVAGGLGLLFARTRRVAALGLVVLLVAVFPANVEMLRQHRAAGLGGWGEAVLWLRLPLQAVLAWWVWRAGRRGTPGPARP